MTLNTNYLNIYAGTTNTKQTYIDIYDKSVKLPFLKVLNNNVLNHAATRDNDSKIDTSELVVSDNIELSSAVTGASEVSGSGIY